jgi:hypothetical protein
MSPIDTKKELSGSILRTFFASTNFLTNGLWLIATAILFVGYRIGVRIYQGKMLESFLEIVLALSIAWYFLGCLFVVIRKEIPRLGMPPISGTWAVVQGIIGILVFASLEVVMIYLIIT